MLPSVCRPYLCRVNQELRHAIDINEIGNWQCDMEVGDDNGRIPWPNQPCLLDASSATRSSCLQDSLTLFALANTLPCRDAICHTHAARRGCCCCC